jgi:2-methylisocitrate lyase-like PEP mutase family enzyme
MPSISTMIQGIDGSPYNAVSKPVNVLAIPSLCFAEMATAGARRVSVGGSLTWVAVKAMADAAQSILVDGDFSALATRLPLEQWLPD